ncbi:MAG TPA: DUF1385 domain-containing protein [candidate division Zixibacteria bacterium]|nr:DUF1385 domain-containing protein [candidate division Zixibacteria bacterium]
MIEGVMMRSADRIATAVRKPNGEILVKCEPYLSLTKRHRVLGAPIIRGTVSFAEMLVVGIRTLNFSADVAMREIEAAEAEKNGAAAAPGKDKKSNALVLELSVAAAFALGIGLFFFLPLALASLVGIKKDAVGFNLLAGGIRLALFVGYVWMISFLKDFKRIFQYHGAEHKSIYAYEMGDDLTPGRAALYTRFHPRCGTSFILIVALTAILIYAVSDSLFAVIAGHPPSLATRFAVHLALLPLVAGGSYELLKLSGRTRDHKVTRVLIQPGLWLQAITTREPSFDQLEVAIVALETALGRTESKVAATRIPVS